MQSRTRDEYGQDRRHNRRVLTGCLLRVAFSLAVLFGSVSAVAQDGLSQDGAGWTVFSPSADSRILYVSETDGNDATAAVYSSADAVVGADPFNPVGPIQPFESIGTALSNARSGFPDWVLLKRGGTWYESQLGPPSGRSASERTLLGAYGPGPARPLVKSGEDEGIRMTGSRQYFAVVSLAFYAHTRDPDSPEYGSTDGSSGFSFLTGSSNDAFRSVLFEDCLLRFYSNNTFQDRQGGTTGDIVLRRNVIVDNYSGGGHSQGMFAYGLTDVLLEENVFDHDGWLLQNDGTNTDAGGATMFNHDTYFSECSDVLFRGNMFLRASSIGTKWRADWTGIGADIRMENNLIVEGEVGISLGGNTSEPLRFVNPVVTSNVLMHIGRTRPTNRALGWYLGVSDWDGGLVAGNLFIHETNTEVRSVYAIHVQGASTRNVTVRNNIAYGLTLDGNEMAQCRLSPIDSNVLLTGNLFQSPDFPGEMVRADALAGYAFLGNRYYSVRAFPQWFYADGSYRDMNEWTALSGETGATRESITFADPGRTVETYNEFMGAAPTMESFVAEVRQQSKTYWRPEYTAAAINDYVRAGFVILPADPRRTEYPTDDTWIRASGEGPKGSEVQMRTFTATATGYAFLKFPIGESAGEEVEEATLRIYTEDAEGATLTVRKYPDGWDEETLTYDNVPAPPDSGTPVAESAISDAGWYEIDVTAYLEEQLAAGDTHISFSLNTDTGLWRNWSTKETPSHNDPELLVRYKTFPPPAGTYLFIH